MMRSPLHALFLMIVALVIGVVSGCSNHTASTVTGLPVSPLETLFVETFHGPFYEDRKCGVNIAELLLAARQKEISLNHATVWKITNEGFENFGMVAALNARPYYSRNGRFSMNWDFHVVLEQSGRIMDYDYTNQPQVAQARSYVSDMFLSDPKTAEKKLKDYRITKYPAAHYLAYMKRESNELPETVVSLQAEICGTSDIKECLASLRTE